MVSGAVLDGIQVELEASGGDAGESPEGPVETLPPVTAGAPVEAVKPASEPSGEAKTAQAASEPPKEPPPAEAGAPAEAETAKTPVPAAEAPRAQKAANGGE